MNQMELKTHECLQFFLPRIAVALEEIAKELKETKQNKPDDTTPGEIDLTVIDKSEAYHMIHNAGIPVVQDRDGNVMLSDCDTLIGECIAYLNPIINPIKTSENKISTSSEVCTLTVDLTVAHIRKFIADYKALERELKLENIQQQNSVSLNDTTECESIKYVTKLEALKMMMDAGIPLQFDDDGDVVLSNGELILGSSLAFLTIAISSNHQIITTGESIKIKELTESHIKKFITDYKTLEKETSK